MTVLSFTQGLRERSQPLVGVYCLTNLYYSDLWYLMIMGKGYRLSTHDVSLGSRTGLVSVLGYKHPDVGFL